MKTLASLCLLLTSVCLLEAQHVPGFLHRHQQDFVNPYPPLTGFHWQGFMVDEVEVWKWSRHKEAWDTICHDCGVYTYDYNKQGRLEYIREKGSSDEWVVQCRYDSLGRVVMEETKYDPRDDHGTDIRTIEYKESFGRLESIEIEDDQIRTLVSPYNSFLGINLNPSLNNTDSYMFQYWRRDKDDWGEPRLFRKTTLGNETTLTYHYLRDRRKIPYQKVVEQQISNPPGYVRTMYVYKDKWIVAQKQQVEVTWIGNSVIQATEYIAYCDTCSMRPWAKWIYRGKKTLEAPEMVNHDHSEHRPKQRTGYAANYATDKEISRKPEELDLAVSPTRTSGPLKITLPYVETDEFHVEIYRLNGVLFYNRTWGGAEAGNTITIDIGDFPNGEYIVYVTTLSQTYSSKVIKF